MIVHKIHRRFKGFSRNICKELETLRIKVLENQFTIRDAKNFYKLKGLSDNDFKDDSEYYSGKYFALSEDERNVISELNYIKEKHRKFIIENIFKTKR